MYTVGEVTAATGVSRKAIRVYEERGLLAPAPRSPAGYRLFTDSDIATLSFIRRARDLGLGLEGIAEILAVQSRGNSPCALASDLLQAQIKTIDEAIADLQALRHQISQSLARSPRTPARVCSIIEN